MVKTESHAFAKQWLKEKGNQIFVNGRQILVDNNETEFDTTPIQTCIEVNQNSENEKEPKIAVVDRYQYLLDLGVCIKSFPAPGKYFSGQKVVYALSRYATGITHIGKMPNKNGRHSVEFDVANKKMRLLGKNAGLRGAGPWLYLESKQRVPRKLAVKYDINDYLRRPNEISETIQRGLLGLPQESLLNEIPELIVMVTDSGELVCIPQEKDEPVIGIFGQRRSGKSYLAHGILDRVFWKDGWNKLVAVLNDSLAESGGYSIPAKSQDAIKELENFNEVPRPLPIVYLAPTCDEQVNILNESEGVGFLTTLPYKEIIRNHDDYFVLEQSTRYFEKIKDSLLEAKSESQVADIIQEDKSIPQNTRNKIEAEIVPFLKKKITDLGSDIPSKWEVRSSSLPKSEFNPVTACLLAGVVPVLQTDQFVHKNYYPQYFRYLVEDVFFRQTSDDFFKRKALQIWFFIDEVTDVGSTEEKTVAEETLNKLVSQGGPKRIGTVLATQSYSKVPLRTRNNIKYLFTFSNPGEAQLIGGKYSLPSKWIDDIKTLGKFEVIAVTTEEFVVYDRQGNKRREKGPFKGRAVSPLSQHKEPKKIE